MYGFCLYRRLHGFSGRRKIALAIEHSIKHKTALLIISKSGGARMMESAFSLMQLAKTSAMLTLLSDEGLPYISLMTDPTTGGVTASFAMLGDLNIAEPKALIGFAGPRVIRETIKRDLPEGFRLQKPPWKTDFWIKSSTARICGPPWRLYLVC